MGETINLKIFVELNKIDIFSIVDNVVGAILASGAKIDKRLGSYSDKTFNKINDSLEHIKEVISKGGGSINLVFKGFTFWIGFDLSSKDIIKISLVCFNSYFSGKDVNLYAGYFLNLSKQIWDAIDAEKIYGLADLDDYVDAFTESEFKSIPPPSYWLNFYGMKFVEEFGKEKILSAPTYKVKEVKEGVLVINSSLPEYLSENLDKTKLYEYFGWKFYIVDMTNELEPRLGTMNLFSIPHLKNYLQKDIQKVRQKNPNIKISVFFLRGHKSSEKISESLKEIESWLIKTQKIYKASIDQTKE